MNSIPLLICAFVLAMVIAMIVFINPSRVHYDDKCTAAGGVVVESKMDRVFESEMGRVCIKKEAIITIK